MWFIFLLHMFWITNILCKKNIIALENEVRKLFNDHEKFVESPLDKNELLCKCNTPGCDEEILEIANTTYSGICRAHKNGICRVFKQFSSNGRILNFLQQCVHGDDLTPPQRPFICQNFKDNEFQRIKCCSNFSFCNDLEDWSLEFDVNTGAGTYYYLLLFFVAVIFSAFGLFVGIFWCRAGRVKKWNNFKNTHSISDVESVDLPCSKQLMIEETSLMTDLMDSRSIGSKEKSRLDQLLDDLERSTSLGSGSGMPLLVQRTISRQVVLKECIGRGRFGEVFLGIWRNEKVAVKIFLSRDEESWRRETEIYRTDMLRHQNILRWFASDNKDTGTCTQLWLITEYLPYGSLFDYLEQYDMNMVLCIQFIRSIAHGMAYLHTELPGVKEGSGKPGIAHRDIKTRNILIKNDMTCAIADLGMAVCCENGQIDMPKNIRGGTARYLAPEFLTNTYADNSFTSYLQMDIYAFALVMWEISRRVRFTTNCGQINSQPYQVPYYEYVAREPDLDEMRQCVCLEQKRPTILEEWMKSPVMQELIRIMCESWCANPNSRLTALNIRCALDSISKSENLSIFTG